jgi:hypothetical protein
MDKKIVWYTASQPQFFPLLYLLERFSRTDYLVLLEEAQYTRKTAQSWTILVGPNGPFRFSIPVNSGRKPTKDVNLAINQSQWIKRACNTLQMTYGKFEAYRSMKEELENILWQVSNSKSLNDVGLLTMSWMVKKAGLSTTVIKSTDLVPQRPGDATTWMASFARHLHATDYIQGRRAMQSYFKRGPFEELGVRLWYQDYTTPTYNQNWGDFEPVVSALDSLLRGGSDLLRNLIEANVTAGRSETTKRWKYD